MRRECSLERFSPNVLIPDHMYSNSNSLAARLDGKFEPRLSVYFSQNEWSIKLVIRDLYDSMLFCVLVVKWVGFLDASVRPFVRNANFQTKNEGSIIYTETVTIFGLVFSLISLHD